MSATLTIEGLRDLLTSRAGGVLRSGKHDAPEGDGSCELCVEELRCLALGLPWGGHPPGCEVVGEAARPDDVFALSVSLLLRCYRGEYTIGGSI